MTFNALLEKLGLKSSRQEDPTDLWPPLFATTSDWWEERVAASRDYDNPKLPERPWNDYGRGFVSPANYCDHLLLGIATARNFVWQKRAVLRGYGLFGYPVLDQEKYREWYAEGPYPLYLHTSLLDGHTYVKGGTGSGKTAGVLMPIAMQLVRGFANPDGTRSAPEPMVIIDLKGDNALFHTVRAEALARGQTFKFFDLRPGQPTYRFNPFSGLGSGL